MLKLGEQDIAGLYVGGTKIKKAYLGETLVFSAEKNPPRLPEGYTELQYIERLSAVNGYMNIPYTGTNPTIRVILDIEPTGGTIGTSYYLLYSSVSSQGKISSFNITAANQTNIAVASLSSAGGGGTTNIPVANVMGRMLIDVDIKNKVASINEGTPVSIRTASMYNFNTGILVPANGTAQFIGKLYSLKIYYDGILAEEYVPAINPSGYIGLFGLANKTFIGQSGTSFTAGPAV